MREFAKLFETKGEAMNVRSIERQGSTILPAGIRWARILLAVVSVGHLIAIVVVLALKNTVREEIASADPQYTPSELTQTVVLELVRTCSFHALLVFVCAFYALRLPVGKPRVVRIIVLSQVLSLVFGAFTVATAPNVLVPVLPPFMLAAAAILVLLYLPNSRSYLRERAHA